jgi:hypothetical protein
MRHNGTYEPGKWSVASWSGRAINNSKLMYRGTDRAEAIRCFERLSYWKTKANKGRRYGIVELVTPNGSVSTCARSGNPQTSWTSYYAHVHP